jgi:hypothetical protein
LFPNATRVARADNLSWVERQQPIRIASLNAQILPHWLAITLRDIERLCTLMVLRATDCRVISGWPSSGSNPSILTSRYIATKRITMSGAVMMH